MTRVEPSFALDANWSEVALALFAQGTVRDTLQQIVDLAVVAVEGCDAAGIFLVENERVVTTAFSEPLVVVLDGMHFEADEGPCLDAVSDGGVFYAEDLADDPRWSAFGPAATTAGIRSLIAYALSADRPSALNLYARLPLAFGAIDRAKGLIFATLAGIALNTAEERFGSATTRQPSPGVAVPRDDRSSPGHPHGARADYRRPGVRRAASSLPAPELEAPRGR